MSQPISIPPLIPLPAETSRRLTNNDAKDDIFATLFSPATPRASPTLHPVPDEPIMEIVRPRNTEHSRTSSTDSEFGSFVSVPSTEDPLHQLGSDAGQPFSPVRNFEFFDRFAEEAKAATERNKKGVLDELLQHEDDPLYFLRSGAQTFA
ncbi:uncharacterized protein PHACADRAFT_189009 [Phanerochaete carnosa HHB-10118-sp]|uniref:Uncharacterized protein n=1 Tax=Phanerochaete carnosa (strain HHB-10118-sp) TaxID=650164 RepID=K5VQH5_PHACS|nr:uncharacterized protein PHACADRAFT_189009 [Phanerochaete carnosa HHB-10118-sp]EKM48990.1 hypothetical protein PHACADRAFT_189009 [Phanerochaete carnosa HHB-10118-sp]